jgi:threonine aldolase
MNNCCDSAWIMRLAGVPPTLSGRGAPELVAALRQRGVLASAMDAETLRLVTHRDVSRADCARAAEAIEQALA